jgi:hypothetical protein
MSRRLLLLAAGCSFLACACSSSNSADGPGQTRPTHGSGGAHSGTGDIHITLGDGNALVFTPGMPREIPVRVEPEGAYSVRFSLVGDTADAYLDKSEADTDADGTTSVVLTPPSAPVVFTLRASVDGASAELPVSAASMQTTIDVVPAYAGNRPISTWVASVDTNSICDPLESVPPSDGLLLGQANSGQSVPVPNVPVGAALRVTVRAGQFAGGCTQVPAFATSERRSVSVTVTDRPLQMNGVKIAVVLGIDQSAPWKDAWSALATTMATSAVAGESTDADALLDAMVVATPYLSQDAFIYGRGVHDWDDRISDILAAGPGATGIRDAVTRWIVAGLPALAKAAISGTLSSPALGAGTASLAVTSIGGATPSDAGFSTVVGLTWTSAAGDQVLFGGTAFWQPSHLAAALAETAATKEITGVTSVPTALGKVISCKDIGTALARDAGDVPFLSCDASCLSSRCETALGAMWQKAEAAVAARAAVHIAASGSATVDDTAHPLDFSGTWVGDASLGTGATHLTGGAKGETPSTTAR